MNIKFIFTVLILNITLWIILVPVWHFPDEQGHFAQVAFMAAEGRVPKAGEYDLTDEILTSEILLGTKRDRFGNNSFTFHPDYRIEYSDHLYGIYEASISALSKTEDGGKFISKESTRYNPIYYFPASIIYNLFHSEDLFVRIFAVRYLSVFFYLLNILFIYLIGKSIFHDNKFSSTSLLILCAFQPMMIFANAGVNNDSLTNLIFTIFLYLMLRLFLSGLKWHLVLMSIIICYLCARSESQFIIVYPIFFISLLVLFIRDYKSRSKYFILSTATLLSVFIIQYLLRSRIGSFVYINDFISGVNFPSLFKFSLEYSIPHTVKEILPWYWGIFDWLGVTYPRSIHRIINRILIISSIGLCLSIFDLIKYKLWKSKSVQGILYLIFFFGFYYIAIIIFDWFSWYRSGYQLGIQGRYFFPFISVQMLLLLLSWRRLWIFGKNYSVSGVKIIGILMILLNFYGIYTISRTYYDLHSFNSFIIQASQYKPVLIKGNFLTGYLFLYMLVMTIFIYKYIRSR